MVLGIGARALARTPEVVADPREGVWIAAGAAVVHQVRERWAVFPAGATVNALAVDGQTVWLATDDGAVRLESASRRQSRLGMDDGLPSQSVTAVAVDPDHVWFATNKGLTRLRKLDRSLRTYDETTGLPHRAVTDLLVVGSTLWVATRGGLALYDTATEGLRTYTRADGLGSDHVEELYQVGDDLWCRTDLGLSRFRPQARRFTNYGLAELGGRGVRVAVPDGERLWVGTEAGLATFEAASEAFAPFPQQAALRARGIVGVEPFTDYLFITTEAEVVQYHKVNRSFRRFTEADGLARSAGARGTVLAGGQLIVLFDDGAAVYDVQRDLWVTRALTPTDGAGAHAGPSWELWTKLDAEAERDLRRGGALPGGFATATGGAGVGAELGPGQSLDVAALLDYGELELAGVRDARLWAEYRAGEDGAVREVQVGDRLVYETLEEGVEGPLLLAGGHARVAAGGATPWASLTADGGLRRGIAVRDFLTGPRREIYTLSRRYVLPASERVYLDGELLASGVDYTVIYPAGQLAFLDPERVDDLSIIEVQYEYDVFPRKGLGVVSLLDLLPADGEVGAWTRAGEPAVVSEESGLYRQIDGGAPKYIDRGWVRSVFAEYREASRTMQVWIHDMGSEQGARDIFDFDLPPSRELVSGRAEVVLDVGLASSYAVKAHAGSFYVELAIDEKTDPAKQSVKLFAVQVLDRGENAGKHTVDALRETLAAARVALAPAPGLELGARVAHVQSLRDAALAAERRELLTGVLDGRYERELEGGSRLTAYAEAAASRRVRAAADDGFAASGELRLAHPWLEGSVSGRHQGASFTPVGSSAALFGTLRDEGRIDATAYPARWLPISVFYARQRSALDDGEGTGVVQHATGRVQLAHPAAPATSVQVGHSLLDDGRGGETTRLKLVGQTDYDLAEGVLKPLGMRRFLVRGLYGVSDATTANDGYFTRGDRVAVSRLEAKLAPTGTESAYALFRSRTARGRGATDGDFSLAARHWELSAGARSAAIPGLIPQVSHTVLYDDARTGVTTPTRGASASLAGQLGIFPGEWLAALTPVAVDARYSYATEERAEARVRTLARRLHRADNRMSYNGMERWELQLQETYELALAGPARARDGERLELRNRVVFRPVHTSPLTLRADYVRETVRNDRTLAPTAPPFGTRRVYEGELEWLMRWSTRLSTKVEAVYTYETARDLVPAVAPGPAAAGRAKQHAVRPALELRYLVQGEESSLFLVQRTQLLRTFGAGGAGDAEGADIAVGVIWSYADNVYLDGELAYRETRCLAAPCSPARVLAPRLLVTAKL